LLIALAWFFQEPRIILGSGKKNMKNDKKLVLLIMYAAVAIITPLTVFACRLMQFTAPTGIYGHFTLVSFNRRFNVIILKK